MCQCGFLCANAGWCSGGAGRENPQSADGVWWYNSRHSFITSRKSSHIAIRYTLLVTHIVGGTTSRRTPMASPAGAAAIPLVFHLVPPGGNL